jgi:hypothetical protein
MIELICSGGPTCTLIIAGCSSVRAVALAGMAPVNWLSAHSDTTGSTTAGDSGTLEADESALVGIETSDAEELGVSEMGALGAVADTSNLEYAATSAVETEIAGAGETASDGGPTSWDGATKRWVGMLSNSGPASKVVCAAANEGISPDFWLTSSEVGASFGAFTLVALIGDVLPQTSAKFGTTPLARD